MNLLITGATGFLGRYVVSEAVRRRHHVRAVVRTEKAAERLGAEIGSGFVIESARVDLRSRKGLVEACQGIDCVLHLAAAKSGDIYAQYAGTVVATENLLAAMQQAGVRHVVHVSTFSVYDYMAIPAWATLDEASPIESDGFDRDEYAQTKLVQERLVVEHAQKNNWRWTVLRPGVIYGRDNLWTARVGLQPSATTWVRTGARSPVPLSYVENCADAIVTAAEKPDAADGQTLNVLDDEHPTQAEYARLIQARTVPRPLIVPVSWTVMRALARTAWLTNKVLFKDRAKVPGIFSPAKLHARIKPMRFTNARVKQVLGWTPRYSLSEALDRSFATPTTESVRAAP